MRRLSLILSALTILGVVTLTGCRSQAAVAAYVDDSTISMSELAAAVDARMADPNIAAVVEVGDPDYQRVVLGQLVQQTTYRMLAERFDSTVTDGQVARKLDELLSADPAQDVDELFARLAAEASLSEIDVRENVRQILVRERVAAAEGLDAAVQESALRERYEQVKGELSTLEFGYLTVPDQQTADSILAVLRGNPSTYEALAATYAGPYTEPRLTLATVSEIPTLLQEQFLQTASGDGFTVSVPETGGVVVGFVNDVAVPEFEAVRETLRDEAASTVDASVRAVVEEFVAGLDIDINPTFGSLEQGQVVTVVGGVVRILDETDSAGPGSGNR